MSLSHTRESQLPPLVVLSPLDFTTKDHTAAYTAAALDERAHPHFHRPAAVIVGDLGVPGMESEMP
jgi:hypothetical protein